MAIIADPIIMAGLLGGLGGLTRGLIGLLKAMTLRRRIIPSYLTLTIFIAMVVVIYVGIFFYNIDIRLALLAGYAGTDIIEGIYKLFKVQKTYVVRVNDLK